MNILMINGTGRKGSSYKIGKLFLQKIAKEEDTVKELFLPKDMPEFCRGCGVCIREDEKKCPDYLIYMKRITELIDDADFLIFTTPTFCYHTTGQMKALLDHYGYRWMVHRPEASMFRKYALCIGTASTKGQRQAIKDIKDSLKWWGIKRIYTYGIALGTMEWEEVSEEIHQKIAFGIEATMQKIQAGYKEKLPDLSVRLRFALMRKMQKKSGNEADRAYWEEQGWLGRKRPWKEEKSKDNVEPLIEEG